MRSDKLHRLVTAKFLKEQDAYKEYLKKCDAEEMIENADILVAMEYIIESFDRIKLEKSEYEALLGKTHPLLDMAKIDVSYKVDMVDSVNELIVEDYLDGSLYDD